MNLDKKEAALANIDKKIEQLQQRAKEIREQKKQAQDMEYLKIIHKHEISAEELQALIRRGKEEQREILKSREKEQIEHEELT